MTYKFEGNPNAPVVARRLVNLSAEFAGEAEPAEASRQKAVSAVANQIRAEEAARADRDLVRSAMQRNRDRRLD